MSSGVIAIALIWGGVSGYLGIRALGSLAGLGFCLHALVTARWGHLAGKTPVKQVSPGIVQQLLFQFALQSILFGLALYYGAGFTRGLGFYYTGWGAVLYASAAGVAVLGSLPVLRRRLVFFWRLSHEFDYAQRRQRTFLLRH